MDTVGLKEKVQTIFRLCDKSKAYEKLVELCDTHGHRISGSDSLEKSIDWVISQMKKDGIENVRTQPVKASHWVRGKESCEMLRPRKMELSMLGIGNSVGTKGITAPVLAVRDFEELTRRKSEANGKIVLFNYPFTNYGETVSYRRSGASEAAKVGGLAALVRSVTPHSLCTPHTGTSVYSFDRHVPAACLATEHADLIQRLCDSGQEVVVSLMMEAQTLPEANSRNVIGELVGREYPDEIIAVGGHIDSWDVGQGAHDDGQAIAIAWECLRILKEAGLRPKRTIRAVFWTDEENSSAGAEEYARVEGQLSELKRPSSIATKAIASSEASSEGSGIKKGYEGLTRHIAAIETDIGVGNPIGFEYAGTEEGRQACESLCDLIFPLPFIEGLPEHPKLSDHAQYPCKTKHSHGHDTHDSAATSDSDLHKGTKKRKREAEEKEPCKQLTNGANKEEEKRDRVVHGEAGVDVTPLLAGEVPLLLARMNDDWWFREYFQIHHTHADTVDKVDPRLLTRNLQLITAMCFLLAEVDWRVPRGASVSKQD